MKEKFIITIESFHYADRGTQNNVSERYEVFGIKLNYMPMVICFMYVQLGVGVIFYA